MRGHYAAALAFAILAVAMTWPLAPNIATAVADPGDPYINTWILDWDWYATLHHPLSLFQADAFHPARYALAFSENLYGIALLLFPLRALGVAPLAAHNVAVLLGFAFSGFAAYLLGRLLGAPFFAAMAAGVFYAFVPFRFTQLTHVQHVFGGWLPLMLVALIWYSRAPSWKRAALFGAVFLLNGLTNIHGLLFGGMAIVLTMVMVAGLRRRGPLLAATAIALLLLAPFLYPYYAASKLYGMQRTWEETLSFSAKPHDWLVATAHTHVYKRLTDSSVDPERWLFPGALSLILGGIGLFTKREHKRVAILWLILGVIGSFGLHTFFHSFLFDYAPGFRAIRVPARWASIAYVGLSMLMAMAMTRWKQWAAALVCVALLIELRAAPIRWYIARPDPPPVYAWLAEHASEGATLELPVNVAGSEYVYLLRATAHHRPIVNGVSGFSPPEHTRIEAMTKAASIDDSLIAELQRIGCRFIIVHGDFIGENIRTWLAHQTDRNRLGYLRRFDSRSGGSGDWLFSVGASMPRTPELEAFLHAMPTRNEETFGWLDYPQPGEVLRGRAFFSGGALSPHGVKEVNLLFDNGCVRLPALLAEDRNISANNPWYPQTAKPRFVLPLDKRPPSIRRVTDVQVEIVDTNGHRTLLEDRFFEWP